MSLRREMRVRQFHRYGPWMLGGGALLALIGYEVAKRHLVSKFTVIYFCCLIPTIVLHEISHGVVANWCGDTTAKDAGRLSLNPLRHIDPIGTVLLPIFLSLTLHQAFGWAKPVPVNTARLRHPRNQAVLVGLAGPLTNALIAVAAALALHFPAHFASYIGLPFNSWPLGEQILFALGEANVVIAAFNLIPLPPLDGSAVLERLLPTSALPGYYRLRQYMMILVIVVVLWAPSVLNSYFNDAINLWGNIVL